LGRKKIVDVVEDVEDVVQHGSPWVSQMRNGTVVSFNLTDAQMSKMRNSGGQ
jgi:hypothetical protein